MLHPSALALRSHGSLVLPRQLQFLAGRNVPLRGVRTVDACRVLSRTNRWFKAARLKQPQSGEFGLRPPSSSSDQGNSARYVDNDTPLASLRDDDGTSRRISTASPEEVLPPWLASSSRRYTRERSLANSRANEQAQIREKPATSSSQYAHLSTGNIFRRDEQFGGRVTLEQGRIQTEAPVRRVKEKQQAGGTEKQYSEFQGLPPYLTGSRHSRERNPHFGTRQRAGLRGYRTFRAPFLDETQVPPRFVQDGEDEEEEEGGEEEEEETEDVSWSDSDEVSEELGEQRSKRLRAPTRAEMELPEEELKRLRQTLAGRKWQVKVGRAGVTPGVVEHIRRAWGSQEVVKVRCEGPPATNMRRTHEELEAFTGGLVIWRAGGSAAVYRGAAYDPDAPPVETAPLDRLAGEKEQGGEGPEAEGWGSQDGDGGYGEEHATLVDLTEGLGPKVEEWDGRGAFAPVDGDRLVREAEGETPLCRPFRASPYGVSPKLSDAELTELRRTARRLQPHFVLGRSKGLEAVAAAILRLWQRTEVAKIAVKKGVQHSNNERMAEELKKLTGGVLLSRDKFFVVLYRGKDFLPSAVEAALQARAQAVRGGADEEERLRLLSLPSLMLPPEAAAAVAQVPGAAEPARTPEELRERWRQWARTSEDLRSAVAASAAKKTEKEAHTLELKIEKALQRKARAEKELAHLNALLKPLERPADRESITPEERYALTKLGQKMRAFLELGKRGVFEGTVENMHLHWKHRDLVKIFCKEKDRTTVDQIAVDLEVLSGGIWVATVPMPKKYAIIYYRGKNYVRPPRLRPAGLLTRRQALKRAVEQQRKQSLEMHLVQLETNIAKLKENLASVSDAGSSSAAGDVATSSGRALGTALGGRDEARDVYDEDEEEDMEALWNYENEEQVPGGGEAEDLLPGDEEDEDNWEEDDNEEAEEEEEVGRSSGGAAEQGGFEANRVPAGQGFEGVASSVELSKAERLQLRREVLHARRGREVARFQIGRSNAISGVAKAIRIHFARHELARVGFPGGPDDGTPVESIVREIEAATGGVVVSVESSELILHRGRRSSAHSTPSQ